MKPQTSLAEIQKEVELEISNKETFALLVKTTFKGLEPSSIKQAIIEGRMRGFDFKDFLEKNVYAIPFGKGYSLVTSIDYARKIGMRSGVIGKTEPKYEVDEKGKIISCSVTIKRKLGNDIGDFTSLVYFAEYTTGRNLWENKPRTMIAKVAESHALRMACPEEMSQVYVEEEMDKEVTIASDKLEPIDVEVYAKKLRDAKTLADLQREWSAAPFEAKQKLTELKDELKKKL